MDETPITRAVDFFPPAAACGGYGYSNPHPQLNTQLEVTNTLGVTICVKDRTGAAFIVPSITGTQKRQLSIRKSYDTASTVNVDTRDITDVGPLHDEDELLIKQLTRETIVRRKNQAILDYALTIADLKSRGGVLYIPTLDLQISLNDVEAPPHPYSAKGRSEAMVSGKERLDGLHYSVLIVDPSGRFGARYANIAGRVYRVPTIKVDPEGRLHEGVWVIASAESSGEVEHNELRSRCYTFEEADQALHLYKTHVDAETLGNPDDVYRREMQANAHRLKLEEAELRDRRMVLENDRIDLERRRLEDEKLLEQTRRELEREREQQKRWQQEREFQYDQSLAEMRTRENLIKQQTLIEREEYERRSLARKDSSELIKYVPLVVATAIGIWIKLSGNK